MIGRLRRACAAQVIVVKYLAVVCPALGAGWPQLLARAAFIAAMAAVNLRGIELVRRG